MSGCVRRRAHDGLSFEPLFVEEMALLAPEGHPFVEAGAVEVHDLAGSRLLLSERSCAYREEIERVLVELGANASVGVEIGSMAALKEAVRRGLGVAVLPEAAIRPPPPGTTVKNVRGIDLGLTVGLLLPDDQTASGRILEAFVCAAREALTNCSRALE